LGLRSCAGAKISAIASRDPARANSFGQGLGLEDVTCGTYEDVAAMDLDAIYIATPPSLHMSQALMCIDAGTPVLVEKPFAITAAEAETIAEAARTKGVFAMEAMWTRFQPVWRKTKSLVESGACGDIHLMGGRFCMAEHPDSAGGLFNAETGGGALLDRGVYLTSLAIYLMGKPDQVSGHVISGVHGVDEQAAFTLGWKAQTQANFEVSLRANAENSFYVSGSSKRVELAAPVFRPVHMSMKKTAPVKRGETGAPGRSDALKEGKVLQLANQMIKPRIAAVKSLLNAPAYSGNAYHYQAEEVMQCIAAGKTESAVMPLDDSIATLSVLDQLRNGMSS